MKKTTRIIKSKKKLRFDNENPGKFLENFFEHLHSKTQSKFPQKYHKTSQMCVLENPEIKHIGEQLYSKLKASKTAENIKLLIVIKLKQTDY
jgi:hypothetical protein